LGPVQVQAAKNLPSPDHITHRKTGTQNQRFFLLQARRLAKSFEGFNSSSTVG